MRGDRVEIVVDSGAGVLTYEIEATKAGRRVEVATSRGVIEVSEVTGTANRFGAGASWLTGSSRSWNTRRPLPPVADEC